MSSLLTSIPHKLNALGTPLSAAGLVALAGLPTVCKRTALSGTASLFDIFILVPGIHTQQAASELNRGELPTTGAMTSGYVFRIENQATSYYMQRIGRPGHLVTVHVSPHASHDEIIPMVLYLVPIALTMATIAILGAIEDHYALAVIFMLIIARTINVVVIKRRAELGWKGASEEGVEGDLLILLSQDRWIRLRGLVDDLKAVTSGQWLRDQSSAEDLATSIATLTVYVAAALASAATSAGTVLILSLLVISAGSLGLSNVLTSNLQMFGRTLSPMGEPKSYRRRLDLAEEMIASHNGRNDWAIGMGLITPPKDKDARLVAV